MSIDPTVSKESPTPGQFGKNPVFNATLRCVGTDNVVAVDGREGCGHVTTVAEATLRRYQTNRCAVCGGRLLLEG